MLLQINRIRELNSNKWNDKVVGKKIIIYKERDPLKILEMWTVVEWSCLGLYSSVWNFWSAISNTIDVNKWVYYIKNENGVLLWRVLVWLTNNWELVRFRMYYWKWTTEDLNVLFTTYLTEIAKEWWFKINDNNRYTIQNIESDNWYDDATYLDELKKE